LAVKLLEEEVARKKRDQEEFLKWTSAISEELTEILKKEKL